eukprot:COSAG02_NODE_2112_length_9802_cov_10.985159_5_plen_87_part_00
MTHARSSVTWVASSTRAGAPKELHSCELHMSHHATPVSCAVMEQIKTLLLAPATDTPLKAEIATQYTSDLAAYEAKVRETVAAYAK